MDDLTKLADNNKKIRFLSGMFEEIPEETIKDVFSQCENDLQKSTAFLLEALDESTNDEDSDEGAEAYE
eukprot:CAMPEP_0168315326 /NCGR_PEP_ID=MMETSP0210-20121227/10823_1 /TAXON_ID=40633 /ORGANISM="Condylostoma magnum, Strain COL2" /LENGTH=68 /DNA_ID=CAMNT_0008287759 /DNA_START=193 /DNA_END=399 /DNA_ORIENTATION=+